MPDDPPSPVQLPAGREARGALVAPPSKSHAIRVLLCAALSAAARTRVRFAGGARPDDVLRLEDSLRRLGWDVREDGPADLVVTGSGPAPAGAEIDAGGAATVLRFLAAVCALGRGRYVLGGSPQLLRRPAGAIVPALRSLGVSVDGAHGAGADARPPLVVRGGPIAGDDVTVDASSSSHAVSALLLVGPVLPRGLTVRVAGAVASRPYVDLTLATMRSFGADVVATDDGWRVRPTGCAARGPVDVEGDWSSAAFLLGAAAATGGDVRVRGVRADSLQADRRAVDLLRDFGSEVDAGDDGVRCRGRVGRPVDVDLRAAPDLAPLAGALACLVAGRSRVRGAAHLRIKESDRIAAVVRCARAVGCEAEERDDGFEVTGPARHGALVDPGGDHRLAMAFAVAGLAVPGVAIADGACVAKSYPGFWDDLRRLLGGGDGARRGGP